MSRPTITAVGSNVKIQVPSGWYTTVSAISRKTYNQLVTCEFEVGLEHQTKYIANKWGQPNKAMRDIDNTSDQMSIIPQDQDVTLIMNFYYSKKAALREADLEDDKNRSTRLNILGSSKSANAPEGFPDYTTFMICVEDGPASEQIAGKAQFDDMIITVTIMNGFKTTPVDTASQAIAETGKQAVQDFINIYTDPQMPGPTIPDTIIVPPVPYKPTAELAALPVGILGAGVSGLYTAMILDSLGIKYEIMESSGRTGGRLFTHNFSRNPGQYQYYDVGAMRYPDTTFMKRTFDLARKRLQLGVKVIPYLRSPDPANSFLCYNNISVRKTQSNSAQPSDDIFKVSVNNKGDVPQEYVDKGTGVLWSEALGPLRQLFVDLPFPDAFKKLMENDMHSVSSYLALEKKYPYHVIKWFETMESRTGLFDQALTETVLASLVFNDPRATKTSDWFCFDGGSEIVSKAMEAQIKTKPTHYQRAVAIKETDNGRSITVTFDGGRNPRPSLSGMSEKKYSNVISTMSFGCLRMVDLENCYLSYGQRNSIRELTYTPSIKIGIQFKTAWWKRLDIVGGQSSTDRPCRDVVYPSYGPDPSHPGNKKSNVMIAAYNGMQDSQRLGGLMKGRDTPEEKVLLNLIMRDLAAIHQVSVDDLWEQYEDYFPWDFYRDEHQLGAFCQFGPGQFKYAYPYITEPASQDQRLHFAGDATSSFHGWVAGALNSSWRAVLGMLLAHPELNPNPGEDIVQKFKDLWGSSEEWDDKLLAKHVYLARELTRIDLGRPQGSAKSV